jgi:predicted DNA-binding transcriptional regulator YafY
MDAHHRREALLTWLRGRPTATAAEAADQFGVSARTILRDVAALRDRGEPVESDAGRGGGLRIDVLRSLPPVRLRLEDIVGLYLWYHLTQVTFAPPGGASADAAIDKLMGVLPPARAADVRKVLRRVVLRPAAAPLEAPQPGQPDVLAGIERALQARRAVALEVQAPGQPAIACVGEPQGLLIEPPAWHLVLASSGGPQLVRVDHITSIRLTEEARFSLAPLDDLIRRAIRAVEPPRRARA